MKAMQPVMNLPDGAVVTIERTERVDGAIRAGMLQVVGEPPPAAAPDTAPPADEAPAEVAAPADTPDADAPAVPDDADKPTGRPKPRRS